MLFPEEDHKMDFSPADLGLPIKFETWRHGQLEAVMKGVDSEQRFIGHAAATGSGKSLLAISHALVAGARMAYLTSTKSLQSQLMDDFKEIGLIDVRGANSYPCIAAPDFGINEAITCDFAPCHAGVSCPMRTRGCLYYDSLARAREAKLVITNYKLWIFNHKYGDGLGKFDLLVLDEAHNVASELSSALEVVLDHQELVRFADTSLPSYDDISVWKSWAGHHAKSLQAKIDALALRMRSAHEAGKNINKTLAWEVKRMKTICASLAELSGARGKWIIDWIIPGRRVAFVPLWPAEYAEDALFLHTPKIVLMSATLRPKTLELLGAPDFDFFESPSTFPIQNRPVYWIPTVGLSHKSTEADYRVLLDRIDEIIAGRLDRKGIVHTVSYRLTNFVAQQSMFRDIMLTHDPRGTRNAIELFKQSKAPCVLVSPSITTGVDFPYDDARYNIVAKLPFADLTSAVLRARMAEHPDFYDYTTAQTIIQEMGRVVRDITDWGEGFILDDNIKRFWTHKRGLFPGWFLAACRKQDRVPKAPILG
jgi:ATP-dependent DNA helicase DinG